MSDAPAAPMDVEPLSATPQFAADEVVLCFHGPLLYEAKIQKVSRLSAKAVAGGREGWYYRVHYLRWRASWDEWVPCSRIIRIDERGKRLQVELKAKHEARLENNSAPTSKKAGKRKRDEADGGSSKAGGEDGVESEKAYHDRPEVKIALPDVLKVVLVDDWEAVTKLGKLVALPRKPTIHELLKSYANSRRSSWPPPGPARIKAIAVTNEIILGLKRYFIRALGANLLYRQERAQLRTVLHGLTEEAERQKKAAQESKETEAVKTDEADPSKEALQQKIKAAAAAETAEEEEELDLCQVYGAEHLLRLLVNLPAMLAWTTIDPASLAILQAELTHLTTWMTLEKDRVFLKMEDYEWQAAHSLRSN